jgi:hypothetical protein
LKKVRASDAGTQIGWQNTRGHRPRIFRWQCQQGEYHHRLAERVADLEKDLEKEIEATTTLRAEDAAEDQNNDDWRSWPGSEDIAKKVAALTEKRAKAPAELPQLENSGESSCREPIRTPGCLSGPPACGLALSAPETASNYANAIWG